MKLGDLRHIVRIIGYRSQKDSANQDIPTQYIVCPLAYCSIETVTGGEVRRGQQMQATTNVLLKMHHPQGSFDVKPEMLVEELHGETIHRRINVVAAYDPNGMRRELHIEGRENA